MLSKNKKNRYTPAYPSFTIYIKAGFKGVYFTRTCFPDVLGLGGGWVWARQSVVEILLFIPLCSFTFCVHLSSETSLGYGSALFFVLGFKWDRTHFFKKIVC